MSILWEVVYFLYQHTVSIRACATILKDFLACTVVNSNSRGVESPDPEGQCKLNNDILVTVIWNAVADPGILKRGGALQAPGNVTS